MEPLTPRIRPGTAGDAEAFAALSARLFRETYRGLIADPVLEAYVAETFGPARQRAELEDPRATVLLAAGEGGALAGYALLHADERPWPDPFAPGERLVSLSRLYVDRAWHGTGVAAALMDAALGAAARHGAGRLWLAVWKENPRAIAFYRKRGFAVHGELPFVMGAEVQEDWLMARAPGRAGAPGGG